MSELAQLTDAVHTLAKAMAYIAVNTGAAATLKLGQRAIALEALGIDTAEEQAALLGSTAGSIRQLKSEIRTADNSRGGNGAKKQKPARRRRGRAKRK